MALLACLAAMSASAGCERMLVQRLNDAKSAPVEHIYMVGSQLVAECTGTSEGSITIDSAELDMNVFGLVSTENATRVVKALNEKCAKKEYLESQQSAEEVRFLDDAKRLGIDTVGLSMAAVQAAICAAKELELPRSGPARARGIQENAKLYRCPDPGAPPVLPTGEWTSRDVTRRGSRYVELDLASDPHADDPEQRAKLRIICDLSKSTLRYEVVTPFPASAASKIGYQLGSINDGEKDSIRVRRSSSKIYRLRDDKKFLKHVRDEKPFSLLLKSKTGTKRSFSFFPDGLGAAVSKTPASCAQ